MASENDVVIYSRPGCTYCSRAKALLRSRGVHFAVADVAAEPERRKEAEELAGARTVPQVFVGRRCLGGFDDLQRLDAEGGLLAALARRPDDGPALAATPSEMLRRGGLGEAEEALSARVEELRRLHYKPGSQPTLRSFLRYAVTGKPAQDQSQNVPLNLAAAPGGPRPPPALPDVGAAGLAELLREAMLQLLDAFVDTASGDVDYARMRESREWLLFRAVAAELGQERLQEELLAMEEADLKAFLINLYNAMTFHGVVTYGRRSGLWFLYCFFIAPAVSYRLAGASVSLDDVENGMLRAQPGYFAAEDQELQRRLRMPMVDARIHMALNCGARGCPAVAVYRGSTLEEELDEAVAAFAADDRNVRASGAEGKGEVKLACTELFKMYIEDFCGPGAKADSAEAHAALARWLLPHARGAKREVLAAAAAPGARAPGLEWLAYDWATNGPEVELDWRIYRPTF